MNKRVATYETSVTWWHGLTNEKKAWYMRLAAEVLRDDGLMLPANALYEKSFELDKAA